LTAGANQLRLFFFLQWFQELTVPEKSALRVRPRTLGQASRIPGVTPAAVSLINVYIEIQARQQAAASSLG
jgi:hypothetical protein